MDIFILIFVVFGLGSIGGGFLLEGGHFAGLLSPSSALIVFGGTIGVTCVSFPVSELKRIPKIFKVVIMRQKLDMVQLLDDLKELCRKSRQEGILSLEKMVDEVDNPLLKKGLGLVVDGYDAEKIRTALELEAEVISDRHHMGASIFTAAGGYAPTMGIVGTVLGLVHVLSDMSDPDSLGPKISAAFIATLYGIGSANILWLPLANNLKIKNEHESLYNAMIIDGLMMIHDGANPSYIEENLSGYLTRGTRPDSGGDEEKKGGKKGKKK